MTTAVFSAVGKILHFFCKIFLEYNQIYGIPPQYVYTTDWKMYITTGQQFTTGQPHYNGGQYFRRKRSTSESNHTQDQEKVLRRSKRSASTNPCVKGKEVRTVIFYAVDADTEEPRELLQDVGKYIMICVEFDGNGSTFTNYLKILDFFFVVKAKSYILIVIDKKEKKKDESTEL